MSLNQLSQSKVCGGTHTRYTHASSSVNCAMTFAVFLPESANINNKVPAIYWLSGLTCTDENFMQKAGAFKKAAELGIAIIAPDTSPRGQGVADDAEGAYDLGLGAGFYINATQAPWNEHYQMYSYITEELPALIEANLPISDVRSISGHSMGGHGALTIGIKNPQRYRSISAFSPITNPSECPWGIKAFSHYLGSDATTWKEHDSCELIKKHGCDSPILIDQGGADNFLEKELKPNHLIDAAIERAPNFELRIQPGYDHSYFFIASFIDEHLTFHARYL
ncbi:S-formylglutathione hydrolase [Vibrio sp. UCD-FRSSP16_10]|uniref:S-formylglutathione hydrolase n=1 Tax=unclassified Vibrio TaxID=2614977 RepID=UPI000801E7E0|nr:MULTISPECIES: S-formylglutathione hydrolase [unclassified Vibrio]OBT16828.1 S-formylglutathione hydrolase [Vibrio sp. UCD-FRSSP16_30]OBT21815.1 S-formylglutathione hydrolase [Vibrio sp. UCD-FRSSP16_10]